MKHIELHIKPALILLLKDKYITECPTAHLTFNQWLLEEELISKMEYERLEKEDQEFIEKAKEVL